jgi:hypothetical protein
MQNAKFLTIFFFFYGTPTGGACGKGWASIVGPLTMVPELRKENYHSVVSLLAASKV